jgi:uncharacterized protein (DUF2141 family)
MLLKSSLGSNRVRRMAALLGYALGLLMLVLTGGCTVTTATSATGNGNLVVDWTILGSVDSGQCTAHGAQTVSVQVFNSSGVEASSIAVNCSAFSATFNALPVGDYTIQAQLESAGGATLANLPASVAATVQDGLTTSETVDFSESAFNTPVAGTGTLEIDWTIAGSADASLCATHSAQTLSIQVFDASNVQYGGTINAACSSLTASVTGLPAGSYSVQAQMLDATGASITTLIGPLAETITSGVVTRQAVDFPEDSFGPATTNADQGTLTVTWTVADAATSSACATNGAADIVLALLDSNNVQVAAQDISCSAFSATLPSLNPGTYTLTAKLVDSNGADVTTTATIPDLEVSAGSNTAQPIDFPTTSFETPGTGTGTGSIAVTWTIASGTTTASCGAHNAASISLQLYQSDGVTTIGSAVLDPCTAFSATISNLSPGAYSLSAQLVNATGSVSTLIPPQPVTVTAGASAPLAFDFPTSAF